MDRATHTGTILVVDDDDIASAGLDMFLRAHGYAVALTANGQEATAYLRDHSPPDLIILDMLMPVMDGWQFLKRREAHGAAVPVLILTAVGIASDAWARSLGACGWLPKPIGLSALLAKVKHCQEPAPR
jgi:DNA-binding response OmpR family regulator